MTEQSKKVLIVIPHFEFRDEEYLITRKALEEAGLTVVVASSHHSIAQGRFDARVQPDITITQIRLDDYGAIIFIGGPGVEEYFDDHEVLSLVRAAFQKRVLLAAISSAPIIFANAGILANRKATSSYESREILEMSGAYYTERSVELDGELITANNYQDSKHFGESIVKALKWRGSRKGYLI